MYIYVKGFTIILKYSVPIFSLCQVCREGLVITFFFYVFLFSYHTYSSKKRRVTTSIAPISATVKTHITSRNNKQIQ